MKTKLKVGQKVFDVLLQQWGEIGYGENENYPLCISFGENRFRNYTNDGRSYTTDKSPVLSLTDWNPWEGTGTFTPIDSEPQPQIGDMVWGWNEEKSCFVYGEFLKEDTSNVPFLVGDYWCQHISLTPPEWILEIIKQQTI